LFCSTNGFKLWRVFCRYTSFRATSNGHGAQAPLQA
jgi:hypothetical protein